MKKVKYERLERWVEEHDARITQAGQYPAQVVFITEADLKLFCKDMGLPHMGKLSGGRCYQLEGEDFFAVIMAFKLGSGQEISAIAHECYHATNFIYKRYGVRHSLNNDEPGAYLISHIAYYAAKFIEEQGYAFTDTRAITADAKDSGDLRPELSGHEQGRVDGSAEPATGADGTVPRQEPNEEYPPIIPHGDVGRCTGHADNPDGLTHICHTCGEELDRTSPYHLCNPPVRQCDHCGVRYYATHKHMCNEHDVINWRKQNEQDA